MKIVTKINEWLEIRKQIAGQAWQAGQVDQADRARQADQVGKALQTVQSFPAAQTIGFVHTMGNLHAGHLSLCQRAKQENDISVAAIFVNPKQFNQASDFALYPRTLEQDKKLLSEQGMDYLLLFEEQELYPDNYHIQISETEINTMLEGEFRPGHFTGMLTIVLKFLNLVQPTRSYYGEKDYQQLLLIKKMAKALFLPVEIVACPTLRTAEGLALSSRNNRLSAQQISLANHFPALLHSDLTLQEITDKLNEFGFKVDYIAEQWQRRLGAVYLDGVRLIDNIPLQK
jgi:pantoate--beta-alanine ligase